jgi:anthranilate synthase/aminodeoxychorismate synthase-like glutamine amidotransferase
MVLVIDNYDSFTYNLVQAIGVLGREMEVYRNDKITVEEALAKKPDSLIVSPGPCTPKEAGVANDLIKAFAGSIPILGVCLGHQCIAYSFGADIIRADRLMHGKTSMIEHDGKEIYRGVPNPFEATRYHSLMADERTLPDSFEITARSADRGELMGIRHREYTIEGVQFHPESFLTEEGPKILANFFEISGGIRSGSPEAAGGTGDAPTKGSASC